jgi:hypothetical protein
MVTGYVRVLLRIDTMLEGILINGTERRHDFFVSISPVT